MKYLKEKYEYELKMPEYFFHGTNVDFNEFSLNYLGKNHETSELGIYFSQYFKPPPYSSTAIEYAKNSVMVKGGTPIVYKCKLTFKDPLVLNSNGWYSSNTYIDKNRNDLKIRSKNNDGIIVCDFEELEIQWRDYIAVTNDLSTIEIIDKIYI